MGDITAEPQESADQEGAKSAYSRKSAILLADAGQLEALSCLRFEPQGTDEAGVLVRVHARAKPWLVAGVQAVERGWLGLADLASDRGSIRASERSVFSPELKAGLATLISMDDDPSTNSGHRTDGLTKAQEHWGRTDSVESQCQQIGSVVLTSTPRSGIVFTRVNFAQVSDPGCEH